MSNAAIAKTASLNNTAALKATANNATMARNTALISVPLLATAGYYALDDNEEKPVPVENATIVADSEMSFMEFLRSYRIAQIPIMDLIAIYIIIYLANALYFKCSYQIPLLFAIIITIILVMVFDPKFKLSLIIILILAMSVYLLVSNHYC